MRSGRIGGAVAALGIASLATGCASHRNVTRIAAVRPGRAYRRVVTAVRIGRSVSGRPIDAVEIGRVRRPRADLLVVGIIHGNEQAGETVVARLRRVLPALPLDAWLVADLNPDGRARNTRQNARGVDLN